jgi:hypothetical protein
MHLDGTDMPAVATGEVETPSVVVGTPSAVEESSDIGTAGMKTW